MVAKPTRGQQDWDADLNAALDQLEADSTAKAEQARVSAVAGLSAAIAASRDRATHTGTQDVSTISGLNAAISAAVSTDVVRTTGAQSVGGIKTFTSKPVVPDESFGVAKIAAAGTRVDGAYLEATGEWSVPSGSGTSSGVGAANTLGTFNNPVTDPAAPRPAGLTRVVWDTPTDPTNWAVGDYNLQKGT